MHAPNGIPTAGARTHIKCEASLCNLFALNLEWMIPLWTISCVRFPVPHSPILELWRLLVMMAIFVVFVVQCPGRISACTNVFDNSPELHSKSFVTGMLSVFLRLASTMQGSPPCSKNLHRLEQYLTPCIALWTSLCQDQRSHQSLGCMRQVIQCSPILNCLEEKCGNNSLNKPSRNVMLLGSVGHSE